jgi:hypothetical protein
MISRIEIPIPHFPHNAVIKQRFVMGHISFDKYLSQSQ